MKFFESLTSSKTILWGALILSAIIIYPNIGDFFWRLFGPVGSKHSMELNLPTILYFLYRYIFFVSLTWTLIRANIKQAHKKLKERFWKSFAVTSIAYFIYVLIGLTVEYTIRLDCFTQVVILQFLIAWLVSVLIGHIYYLTVIQRENEKEMEKLRNENLQSRVNALINQINPHFFFNSLNGLTALVSAQRYDETSEYVSKLSNIFRYILQSEKKGLVKLNEELKFLDAYRYLIEVRYSGKISFEIDVKEKDLCLELPVLSLLPIVENVIKHNIIDSEHKMNVRISVSDNQNLLIENPVYPKFKMEESHGIGLTNLSARYKILLGKEIQVINENGYFTVTLPLKKAENECTDC